METSRSISEEGHACLFVSTRKIDCIDQMGHGMCFLYFKTRHGHSVLFYYFNKKTAAAAITSSFSSLLIITNNVGEHQDSSVFIGALAFSSMVNLSIISSRKQFKENRSTVCCLPKRLFTHWWSLDRYYILTDRIFVMNDWQMVEENYGRAMLQRRLEYLTRLVWPSMCKSNCPSLRTPK